MADKLDIEVSTGDGEKKLNALGVSVDALTESMKKMAAANNAAGEAKKGLDELGKSAPGVSNLSAAVGAFVAGAKSVGSAVAAGISSIAALGNSANTASAGLNAASAATSGMATAAPKVSSAFTAVSQALAQAAQAAQTTGQAAGTLGNGLNQAGASASTMNFNILSTLTNLRSMAGGFAGMSQSLSSVVVTMGQARGSFSALITSLSQASGMSETMIKSLLALAAIQGFVALAQQVGAFAESATSAAAEVARFKAALDSVGSKGDGTKALSELGSVVTQVGGNMQAMLDPFAKFNIAARQAGVYSKDATDIFKGFQAALTVTGATATQTERVFNALNQMMSKGTVQMEELKGQLGDSFPAALGTAAKAMGVSIAELTRMIENGKVLASDLLPKMAAELISTFGPAASSALRGYTQQVTALTNNFFQMQAAFGQGSFGGALEGFAVALRSINGVIDVLNPSFTGLARILGDLVGLLAGTLGAAFAGVAAAIGIIIAPVTTLYDGISNLFTGIKNAADGGAVWAQVLVGLGQALTSTAGYTITFVAGFAAFGGIALLIQGLVLQVGALTASIIAKGAAMLAATGATGAYTARLTAMGVTTGVATVASGLLTTAIGGIRAAAIAASTALGPWGVAFAAVGIAITGLITVFGGFDSVTAAVTKSFSGLEVGSGAFTSALNAMTPSMETIKAGLLGVGAAIAFVNPLLGVIVTGVISTLEYFGLLSGVLSKVGDSLRGFAGYLPPAAAAQKTLADSANKVVEQLNKQPEIFARNALAMVSYTAATTAAKNEITKLEAEIKQEELALKGQAIAIKESSLVNKELIASYKDSRAEINASKAAMMDKAKVDQASVAAQRSSIAGTNEARNASRDLTTQKLALAESTRGANAASREYDEAMRTTASRQRELDLAMKESNLTLEEKKNKVAQTKAEIDRFGVVLGTGARELMGLTLAAKDTEKEAATLAARMGDLLKPTAELSEEFAKLAGKKELQAQAFDQLSQKIQQEVAALEQQKAAYGGLTPIQAERLNGLKQVNKELVTSAAQTREQALAARIAAVDEKDLSVAQEKVNEAIRDFTQQGGSAAEVARAQAAATQLHVDKIKGMGEAQKTSGDAATQNAKNVQVMDAAFKGASASAGQLNTALNGVNTTDIASKFTALATSLQPASDQIINAGASFMKVGEGAAEAVIRIELIYTAIEKSVTIHNTLADTLTNKVVPALSAFDQGQTNNVNSVNSTISALDSLISKYNEVAEAAARAKSEGGGDTGGSGGGDVNVGSNRLGGTGERPGEIVSRPASVFNGAAQLASGIANTNRLTKTDGKGGIPTILHPNEAVIPLASGGKVPVQLNGGGSPGAQAQQIVLKPEFFLSPSATLFNQDVGKKESSSAKTQESTGVDASTRKVLSFLGGVPSAFAGGPSKGFSAPPRNQETAVSTRGTGVSTTNTSTDNSRQNVTIVIKASDFDSFKRSAGQIDTEMFKRTRKAFLRNG